MQNYSDSRIFSSVSVNPTSSSGLKEESVKTGSTYMVNNSNLWKLCENTTIQSQIVYSDDNANKSQGGKISYYLTDSILTIDTKEQYGIVERNLQAEVNLKNNQENYYLNNQLNSELQMFRRDSLYLNTVRAGHIQLNVTP